MRKVPRGCTGPEQPGMDAGTDILLASCVATLTTIKSPHVEPGLFEYS